jgi:hypothetical protein
MDAYRRKLGCKSLLRLVQNVHRHTRVLPRSVRRPILGPAVANLNASCHTASLSLSAALTLSRICRAHEASQVGQLLQ